MDVFGNITAITRSHRLESQPAKLDMRIERRRVLTKLRRHAARTARNALMNDEC